MATRINMLKLMQEMRGMAQITNRRPHERPAGFPILAERGGFRRGLPPKRKRHIQIQVQEPLDIPSPVKITHLLAQSPSVTP